MYTTYNLSYESYESSLEPRYTDVTVESPMFV
jgi:hypothetical protein